MELKSPFRIYCILTVCCIFAGTEISIAGNPSLLNGNFEAQGQPSESWSNDFNGGERYPESMFKDSNEIFHGGAFSLSIERNGFSEDAPSRWFQYVTVAGNTAYRLTAYVRVSDVFSGNCGLMVNGCGINELRANLPSNAVSQEWRELELTFTPLSSGDVCIYLQHTGEGKVYFDDVELVRTDGN